MCKADELGALTVRIKWRWHRVVCKCKHDKPKYHHQHCRHIYHWVTFTCNEHSMLINSWTNTQCYLSKSYFFIFPHFRLKYPLIEGKGLDKITVNRIYLKSYTLTVCDTFDQNIFSNDHSNMQQLDALCDWGCKLKNNAFIYKKNVPLCPCIYF